MLALSWYKGRDGAGAEVDVWRILHAACCMLYAVCSMMSGVNLGWVWAGLGHDKGLY